MLPMELRLKNRPYIFFCIIAWLIFTSCQAERITQNQLKLERYAVKRNDLPKGWTFDGEDWDYKYGGETYLAAYTVPNNRSIGIAHSITLYKSEEQAEDAFPKWQDEWFTATRSWPGAEFTPIDSKDAFIYECQQLQLTTPGPLTSCSFLQKHGDFIVSILVTLDDQAMTLEQFNGVLQVLDKRLNDINFE